MAIPDYPPKDVTRFWSKVDRRTPDECWNWQAGTNKDGYGFFALKSKCVRAHRVAYELATGKLPSELKVLHSCDNPACCNPAHLSLGTQLQNMKDRNQKGRQARQTGETNGGHKLTLEDVQEIRRLYKLGGTSQREIAKEFGISRAQAGRITSGQNWKDVPPAPEPDECGCCGGDSSECGGAIQVDVDRFYCQNTRRGSW